MRVSISSFERSIKISMINPIFTHIDVDHGRQPCERLAETPPLLQIFGSHVPRLPSTCIEKIRLSRLLTVCFDTAWTKKYSNQKECIKVITIDEGSGTRCP